MAGVLPLGEASSLSRIKRRKKDRLFGSLGIAAGMKRNRPSVAIYTLLDRPRSIRRRVWERRGERQREDWKGGGTGSDWNFMQAAEFGI